MWMACPLHLRSLPNAAKQSPALWISEPKKKTRDWSIDHSALHVQEEMVLTTLRRQAQESPLW
jgi:hypothetical protein